MKPVPGWPRITPELVYRDARRAIDWLCTAYGFQVRVVIETPDGGVAHAELSFGDGLIMVGEARDDGPRSHRSSPAQLDGAVTGGLCVYVDDVEAHHDHAVAHGAEITEPLATVDHGPDFWADRIYATKDLEGHRWWFVQRLRTGGGGG